MNVNIFFNHSIADFAVEISTAKVSNRNRDLPKVFAEKGLYIYHSKILKFSDSQFYNHSQFPPNAVYNLTKDNKAEFHALTK